MNVDTENRLALSLASALEELTAAKIAAAQAGTSLPGKVYADISQSIRSVQRIQERVRKIADKPKNKAKREEERLIATTCFHCGEPAMSETHGPDPRCERHRDV